MGSEVGFSQIITCDEKFEANATGSGLVEKQLQCASTSNQLLWSNKPKW